MRWCPFPSFSTPRALLAGLSVALGVLCAGLFCLANAAPVPQAPFTVDFPALIRTQLIALGLLAVPSAVRLAVTPRATLRHALAWPRGFGFRATVGGFALLLAGAYALNAIVAGGEEQSAVALLAGLSPLQRAMLIPTICLLTPLAEEALFRGVLLRAAPAAVALPASAALFALAHGPDRFVVPLVFVGFLLGALTLRTRSLLPAILLHTLFNLFAFACL